MEKKLHRKNEGKMVFGVCAGLAEYMNVDVTIVRIVTVLLSLGAGSGLFLYILAAILMPAE
jgi:phage shock protein PspC (stress-responsive transcriptional regulator)